MDALNRRAKLDTYPFSYCLMMLRNNFNVVVTRSQMIKSTHSTMILHPFTKPLSQAAPRIAASASSSSTDVFLKLRGGASSLCNAPFDFDLAKTRLEGEIILIYYYAF